MSQRPTPGSDEWLAQETEEIVDPGRPIVDPHHHLWRDEGAAYVLEQLRADTSSGHRIEKTIVVEAGREYRTDGPDHLKPLGETEFVVEIAKASRDGRGAEISGIVPYADLRGGALLSEALDGHAELSEGLLCGIRHCAAHATHPETLTIPWLAPAGLMLETDFQAGVAELGRRELVFDSWHYHYQNREFLELAKAVPNTVLVLDHFGTPLGVGPYANHRAEIHAQWRKDIADIAKCDNVVAKLGGLAMPDNGFGWDKAMRPATSDDIVKAHRDWYLHTIECFGVERCMMESNFPVDRQSVSYTILFNALKKMVGDFSASEKDALFRNTATRVYRLFD